MIRYADIQVKTEIPKFWELKTEEFTKTLTYQEIVEQDATFKDMKDELKKHLHSRFDSAIDACEKEEEIGDKLNPLIEQLDKGYFMTKAVNPNLLLNKANKNTIRKKLQEWCDQANANVPIVRRTPGTSIYHNAFKDVPCIVVSAGPSLQQAIEHLKRVKGKALIMALDTSYRSLTKRGITPDFVNAHDANENGKKFFKDIDSRNTVACFVNYVHPETIKAYAGPICFYYVEDDSLPVYKTMALAADHESRPDGSFLKSGIIGGSSVAHTAMYAAINMGCNPITYVGLDLSFPDMSRSHFESDNMKNPADQHLIDVMAINGRMVKTNLSFYSYKVVFDRMATALQMIHGVKLYTSSENPDGSFAGIVHNGLEPIHLSEFIDRYATANRQELHNVMEVYKKYNG